MGAFLSDEFNKTISLGFQDYRKGKIVTEDNGRLLQDGTRETLDQHRVYEECLHFDEKLQGKKLFNIKLGNNTSYAAEIKKSSSMR